MSHGKGEGSIKFITKGLLIINFTKLDFITNNMSEKEGLKLLWSSVSPTLETGYGRVTKYVCDLLRNKHGMDVKVHGYQTQGRPHTVDQKYEMLSHGGEPKRYGADKIRQYLKKYDRDVFITLYDVWAFPDDMAFLGKPWIAYVPYDAEPPSRIIITKLKRAFKVITYSDFAKKQLEEVGIESTMIPHGVDTETYRPLEDKKKLRENVGVPEDSFLIGTVGMNLYDRKDFPRMMRIFSKFLEETGADAYLYIHADPDGEPGKKYSLRQLAHLYGVRERVAFKTSHLSDEGMTKMYNTFDVYWATSRAEGCGMPILEAQACGTPAIVPDNSAQPEWVEGHGWVVPCCDHIVVLTTPQHNKWPLVDVDKSVEALKEAYEDDEKRQRLGREARKAMLEYDWAKIVEEKWLPFFKQVKKDLENPYGEDYFENREHANKGLNYIHISKSLKGNKVLEVGCGDGELLEKLKKQGYEVYGCDISEEAVKRTKKRGIENVKQIDVDKGLPYEDEEFDTVYSMHLLEHLENDRALIQETVRVAKERIIHLIPLGFRDDWTHKRVYGFSRVMAKLGPTWFKGFRDGDLCLIYEKEKKGNTGSGA